MPSLVLAHAATAYSVLTRCLILCLIEMGREKRKGKEVVGEKPVRKRTRAEREAERGEMVAKAVTPCFKFQHLLINLIGFI